MNNIAMIKLYYLILVILLRILTIIIVGVFLFKVNQKNWKGTCNKLREYSITMEKKENMGISKRIAKLDVIHAIHPTHQSGTQN